MGVSLAALTTLLHRAEPLPATPFHIIPRLEWGALPPDRSAPAEKGPYDPVSNPDAWFIYDKPLAAVLHTVIVHHTAARWRHDPRQVQRWHMTRFGFADVGYHFLIGLWGEIYEGRSLRVRGAHTAGFNTGSIGIALMGNFAWWPPTAVQLFSLQALATALSTTYFLSHLAGHQDFQPGKTECPGNHLGAYLTEIAAAAGLAFGVDGFARRQE
jgi:hypothetical protein